MATIETINVWTIADDHTWDSLRAWMIKVNNNFEELNLDSVITVKVASDLSWTLDSTKLYFIDWVIDMWTTQIIIPQWGLQLKWNWFNISKLISSENNYTMFIDDGVYSWDFLFEGLAIEVTWTSSQAFNLDNDWNGSAFELSIVNFNNCTSLWSISNYRQGLELNTGRFWGSPSLTLNWTWSWGYRCTTSIVRGLSSWMTTALFSEGVWFTMASRFLTDINCDLPANASFCDFQSSNFINPSTLQIQWAILSRNWTINASDTNILPNISATDLVSSWVGNNGIDNTFVGGNLEVDSISTTVISAGSTYYTLNANWGAKNLSHFDTPSAGQLRHLGQTPIEFKVQADFTVECSSNNVLAIRARIWRDSTSSFVEFQPQIRQVNSLIGGRDVAFFSIFTNTKLNQNDYIYFQIANNSGNNNATLEVDSFFVVEER